MGVEATKEELAEWKAAEAECRGGHPRRFIESFLWIKDVDKHPVPMKLHPLQVAAYNATFGRPPEAFDFYTAMEVVEVKPRDAKSTTLWMACGFAFRVCIPGIDVGMAIDVDDKIARVLAPIDDFFYENLPPWLRPKQDKWDVHFRQFIFKEGGRTTWSSMEFVSSLSENAARSGRCKLWILSEEAYNDPNVEPKHIEALNGSMTENAWRIKESTPNKPAGDFYQTYRDVRSGEAAGIALFFTWFDKPEAFLEPHHPSVRPVDRREIEETGGLAYTEDERTVIRLFHPDGVKPLHRILWRRRKLGDYTRASDGDPKRGRAAFLRDNPENDVDCWFSSANSQFDADVISAMIRNARAPILDTASDGLRTRIWKHPVPGEKYIVPADFSTGKSKDSTAIFALSIGSGEYVAEIHGKAFVRKGVAQGWHLAGIYNDGLRTGLWTPETNFIGSETADIAVKDLPAPDGLAKDVYRRPPHRGENTDTEHFRKRPWGWDTGGGASGSRQRMLSALTAGINSGRLWTRNEAQIRDWQAFDPDSDEHLRDRNASGAIGAAVLEEKYGRVEGRAMMSKGGGKRVFLPPGPARPFRSE